ncbi:MAG TPA: peptidylprolyl isomerase, partial [Candidatus Paceibacterota bacterium]|nr:peptidylprolyl isomerase [Candidatus Paceibacterota bacterium]
MEKIKINDFVEIEFTGKIKEGDIFDTNIKEDASKIGLKIDDNPFIICVGKRMLIEGFDNYLEGKEVGKKYFVELSPEKAFGIRKKELVKLIPLKIFKEKEVNPYPGLTLNIDGMLVKIVSVSGGRVLVDFNNPLSSKTVIYEFTIKRKIEDINEKVKSIFNFTLKQKIDFKIENNKIIVEAENYIEPLIKMINDQFHDALGMEMTIKEKKEDKEKEDKEKEDKEKEDKEKE